MTNDADSLRLLMSNAQISHQSTQVILIFYFFPLALVRVCFCCLFLEKYPYLFIPYSIIYIEFKCSKIYDRQAASFPIHIG